MDFYIYLACLAGGFFFTLLSILAGHLFDSHHDSVAGSGGHAEAGFDSGDMPSVSAWSPTVISAFVTSFGGFGIIFNQLSYTRSAWISAPLAIAGGFGAASVVLASLRWLFRRTQGSSESQVATLIGVPATIITPIPENGVGEIAYVQSGSRYSAPARSENGQAVASGRSVRITRILGAQYYVIAE